MGTPTTDAHVLDLLSTLLDVNDDADTLRDSEGEMFEPMTLADAIVKAAGR